MDAIKKKMQAMKIEKDNALDRADAAEEKVRQITEKLERVEEELRDTQKKMTQTGDDLDKAQEDLSAATSKLEEKEKTVQEVFPSTSTSERFVRFSYTHKSINPLISEGRVGGRHS
uniref:Tropomyosin n=1 Tax=Caenorhabditis tropicalis TaxID=1561998 RepID=A0A1I7USY0_9PELO